MTANKIQTGRSDDELNLHGNFVLPQKFTAKFAQNFKEAKICRLRLFIRAFVILQGIKNTIPTNITNYFDRGSSL